VDGGQCGGALRIAYGQRAAQQGSSPASFAKLGKRSHREEYRWRTMSASASAANPVSYRTSVTLGCGLDLLRHFTPEHPERGIGELAHEMHVSRSTAHRYASTFFELGWLAQGRNRLYRLTRRSAQPGMAVLGSMAVTRQARPILRELREQTGRTVSLVILDGAEVLYVLRLRGFERGSYQLEKGLGAGSRRPARATAAGRALLAAARESEPPSYEEPSGLTVDEGDAQAAARGLAVLVTGKGERTSAIELTVPAEAIGAQELIAALGKPLWAAAVVLQVALGAERAEECVSELTT
jgi:hypothetical protein